MVSQEASRHRKVILGGQGGDEIFGGYTRYLVAYFEQCIRAAIDGTMRDGNFVVTYESIIPNLVALRNYKPMLQEFWREGLFEDLDARYFRLINRTPHLERGRLGALGDYSPFDTFQEIFNGTNVGHQAYFDKMTHFDFKTLLPALLQVEDRVSMAHGLESRVPLLDHRLVELAATIPADIKFKDGTMKHIFKRLCARWSPTSISRPQGQDGLPGTVDRWLRGAAREFASTPFDRRRPAAASSSTTAACSPGWATRRASGARAGACCASSFGSRLPRPGVATFKRLLTTKGQPCMKVLITGGGGFIGSHLADRLLADGHDVLVIDNYATGRRDNLTAHEGLTIVEATIADADAVDGGFAGFRPDCVVHAAASYKDPDDWAEDVRTNALGTANVVRRGAGGRRRRLIYFQTALCYGTAPARAADHARPPGPAGLSYAISQDRRRAVHRAERAGLRLLPARQRLRAAQHLRAAADLLPAPDRRASPAS